MAPLRNGIRRIQWVNEVIVCIVSYAHLCEGSLTLRGHQLFICR